MLTAHRNLKFSLTQHNLTRRALNLRSLSKIELGIIYGVSILPMSLFEYYKKDLHHILDQQMDSDEADESVTQSSFLSNNNSEQTRSS